MSKRHFPRKVMLEGGVLRGMVFGVKLSESKTGAVPRYEEEEVV